MGVFVLQCWYCMSSLVLGFTECYHTFSLQGSFRSRIVLHVTFYLINSFHFLRSVVYYDQLKSARHVVYPDQLVGAGYTLNILSQ